MAEGGVKLGLKPAVARLLAEQTMYGTAKFLRESGMELRPFIEGVCTKGGTTAAGMEKLDVPKFKQIVAATLEFVGVVFETWFVRQSAPDVVDDHDAILVAKLLDEIAKDKGPGRIAVRTQNNGFVVSASFVEIVVFESPDHLIVGLERIQRSPRFRLGDRIMCLLFHRLGVLSEFPFAGCAFSALFVERAIQS